MSPSYPQSAVRYRAFLAEVFGGSVRQPTLFDLPETKSELELQSLWFAGAWGREFISTCGKLVRIRQFGHWNRGAGPDFTESAVEVEGELLCGAIELDQDPRDWERHGHATNPEFNKVVLHLFCRPDSDLRVYTQTEDHRNVIQVALDLEELEPFTAASTWKNQPEAKLGRCAAPLRQMDPRRIESLLDSAAQYRLESKGRRLHLTSTIHGRDEALFQGIAEALGYRPNKLPMRVLAQRFPIRELMKLEPLETEARLFGTAGFLSHDRFESAEGETRKYLRDLWDRWWKLRDSGQTMPKLDWTLTGIRPLNHPQRRLGAMVALVGEWKRLMKLIPVAGSDTATSWPKRVSKVLEELNHPYWSYHYTLQSKPVEKAMALIGKDRIRDILGNTLFPLIIPDHPEQWSAYRELPASVENEKLRRAGIRLFGEHPKSGQFTRKFYQQQGLLQVYEDYCLEDWSECEDCPFPEQLAQW